MLVDGKVLTLHFAYVLFIIICQNYGQVLTYNRTNYFPCRCTCGNCSRDLLANISECYCCKELKGNWEALTKFNCRMEVVSLSNEQVNFLFVTVPQFTKSIVSFRRICLAKCSKSNKSWRLM